MSFVNGSIINSSDANSAASNITFLRIDNAKLPATYWLTLSFPKLVASTAEIRRTRNIILPDDCILTEVAITGGEHSGTATVSVDNSAMVEPILMTAVLGANFTKGARYYSDTTKPVQLLLAGSILTVSVVTTNVSVASTLNISLGLATEWRRA